MPVARRLLIAIDFDGTLLGPDGRVSPATKVAIRKVLDAGHEVVFATGRAWHESREVVEQVDHRGQAVFVGGAFVIDTDGGRVLHRQGMDVEVAREVCGIFERHGLGPLVLLDRDAIGVDYALGPHDLPPAVADWHERNRLTHTRVGDLTTYGHEHTMRVGTLGPAAAVDAAHREVDHTFGERVLAYKIDLATYGVELLEVFDPSVNKWAGVERVALSHGIDRRDVVAIGDDMNDLHLIEGAGVGVAMGNAKEPVKAIADLIIGTNADDGLATFLTAIADAADDAALGRVLTA